MAHGYSGKPAVSPSARRWLAAAVLAACSAAAGGVAAAACQDRPAVPLEPVAAGVWRLPAARGEADAANGGLTAQLVLVRQRDRVWMIGSGPSPAFGAALACAARQLAGRPVTDLVVTRAAPELAMGDIAFPRARLWALPDVIAVMRARCPACLDRLKARTGPAGASLLRERIRIPFSPVGRLPDAVGTLGPFDWQALLRAPNERVLVLRHRASGIVVAQGLLWVGDIPNLRDTDSARLLVALEELRRYAAGGTLLGEQGDPAPASAVQAHIDYLQALRRAALPHLLAGDVDGASGVGVDLPAFAALPGYALGHPLNVQHVWRELEPEIFR